MRNFIGRNGFIWFVGVVEDRDDPVQLGRLRVRVFGHHTDDKSKIKTEDLPWAQVMNGVQSASVNGLGFSPTGIVEGSWVIGFFMDGERAQEPVIMGTLPGIPSQVADPTKGFNDPTGTYPKWVDDPDVNKLARGLQTKPHTPDSTIGEPDDPYAAEYPKNHVMETESGHTKEYDDTPSHERIREMHKSGTFYEVHPDGSIVTHVVKDGYRVVAGDDAIHVKGNVNIVVDNDATVTVGDNATVTVGNTLYATAPNGDVYVDGVSLVNHTHPQNSGNHFGGGTDTSPPNKV